MTAPLFSKEFVRSLAIQADNAFDCRGDFALHFCVRGGQLHVELSPATDDLVEVIVEEKTVDGGGIVQRRSIRHAVPETGDPSGADEATADPVEAKHPLAQNLAKTRGRNK